jgi:hypothetical protein
LAALAGCGNVAPSAFDSTWIRGRARWLPAPVFRFTDFPTTRRIIFPRRSLLLVTFAFAPAIFAAEPAARWWKGNLHTHTLWSDGDDYPEVVTDWYKQHGYNFLALSDHNIVQEGQRWLELKPPTVVAGELVEKGGGAVLEHYRQRFGDAWVEQRTVDGKKEVRLKPLGEFGPLFNEPNRFLLIAAEEMSTSWKQPKTATEPEHGGPVHMNVTNIRDMIAPVDGRDALFVMQRNIDLVLAQRERTGQPMLPHLNHPNYVWGVTAEELMQVKGERFFEVYNGHAAVHNAGDAAHLGVERMWDVILAFRLTELQLEPMFGVATDDSHNYQVTRLGKQNPGRGWVMVRAKQLTPEAIVLAMEAGDYYASSGVTLADVRREGNTLSLEIAAEPGVTYTTQFIGTRRGFDRTSRPIPPDNAAAAKARPHRQYSADVGADLAEVKGVSASYTLKGDELYVRAKVISSKPKPNASSPNEMELAWTQPLIPSAH